MPELGLAQVVAPVICGVDDLLTLVSRIVEVRIVLRWVPGLVGVKGIHIQEERLPTVVSLQPPGGLTHRAGGEVVLLPVPVAHIPEILLHRGVRAPELPGLGRERGIGRVPLPRVVLLATDQLPGLEPPLVVVSWRERVRCIHNEAGKHVGFVKCVLKCDGACVQRGPGLERPRVLAGENVVAGGNRGERGDEGVVENGCRLREPIQVRRVHAPDAGLELRGPRRSAVAPETVPTHRVRDNQNDVHTNLPQSCGWLRRRRCRIGSGGRTEPGNPGTQRARREYRVAQ